MEESRSQLQLLAGDCRDTRIIGKIRDFLFSQASGINPSVIERRIQELFPSFHTPTHLPYALMIQKAVRVLNERNGSTKEAISEFMKNEFQDLPWAHSSILDLHLGKLCQAGELFHTMRGRYMLMEDYNKLDKMKETQWRGDRRRKKYKRGRNHRGGGATGRSEGAERFNEFHEQENEGQNNLSELNGTGTYQPIKEQGKSEKSQLGVTEVGHGQVVPGGEAEMRQNENTHERTQEAILELKDKIRSREIMNTEPHMVEKRKSMVIKLRIPCKKRPDNLRNEKSLERSEGAERCNELREGESEQKNHLSELHGTGAYEIIEEQGKSEIGQLGVTECEKQSEATTEISRFCSDEISRNENLSASLGSHTVAENQSLTQPQLYLQMSWDRLVHRELGTTSKTDDSLSSMNCLEHKQRQHGNKRGLKKLNLDGKTESGHVEQQSPKRRCGGRPPKPVPTQDYQWSWVAVEHRVLQP